MASSTSEDSGGATARRNIREGRNFALTLAGGFLLVGLVSSRKGQRGVVAAAVALSLLSLLAALLIPGRLGPARAVWIKLGEAIGNITTPIVMAIVYYVVVTPIGIARRLTSGSRRAKSSHWYRRPPLPEAARMERQF